MSTTVEVHPSVDYRKRVGKLKPAYRYSKILPSSGSTTAVIAPTAGQETLFELPNHVMNLSKSVLAFDVSVAASGAGNFNWIPEDCLAEISQLQLYTRSGQYLADLNFVSNYTCVSHQKDMDISDFDTNDIINRMYTDDDSAVKRHDNTDESKFSSPARVSAGADNTALTYEVRYPLNQLRHCLLSMNKNLYFNDSLVLRILWNPGNRMAWYSTSGTDPTAGASAIAVNVTISNIACYAAVQENLHIVEAVKGKVLRSGLKLKIPYILSFKNNLSSTSQNINLRLNRGHGETLRWITSSAFNGTETSNTMYDQSNIDGVKISSYQSYLNSNPRQNFLVNMSATAHDDYMVYKHELEGKVAGMSEDIYRYRWFALEDFAQCDDDDDHVDCGLSLNEEQNYSLQMTTASATFNHYTFVCVQRELRIMPDQIEVVSSGRQ